ncbi:MAG TPA: imidazolonepropionase [Acidimicrobiales bacterium]|nr:imidazolonepropionase [Acidimicrobiales bacterium]
MVIDRIGELATNDPELGPGPLGIVENAAVVVEDGRIAWVGPRQDLPQGTNGPRLDVGERGVIPGFVDSHSHLVFAGDRSREFAARMAGQPYAAGGIRATVAATRAAPDPELAATARRLAAEALAGGTTTLEVKSGYGLTVADEVRSLRIAGGIQAGTAGPEISPTFLGAHIVPPEHEADPASYLDLVRGPMLDACAPMARWCDVFCDRGAFDADQAREVLRQGASHGLGLRVHANQLAPGPGAALAAEMGATSADHLTHLSDTDIAALADAGVVATLLPGAEFSTASPYPDARRLLAAGVTVALATDCNPGTSYTTSMSFVVALAVRELHLTPDQALWAATAGGAAALARDDIGHLGVGARGDLVVLDAPSHLHLAYRPGVPLVTTVLRAGDPVVASP